MGSMLQGDFALVAQLRAPAGTRPSRAPAQGRRRARRAGPSRGELPVARHAVDDGRRQPLGVGGRRLTERERYAVFASSGTSTSRLRILPVGPLGSSSGNQILRGYL